MKTILSAGENRRIAKAMLDYSMLSQGDRVLIAVSGGVDSLLLAWVLHNWRRKAPIDYEVRAVYVDMQPTGERAGQIGEQLASLGLSCVSLPTDQPISIDPADEHAGICYQCARNRRRQLFEYARQEQYNKIALGHHRDDIVETFFINLTSGGNISTMRPRQELFSGRLSLIRPLAYLKKEEIRGIGKRLCLEPVASNCPLSEKTRRRDVRALLQHVYEQLPAAGSISSLRSAMFGPSISCFKRMHLISKEITYADNS